MRRVPSARRPICPVLLAVMLAACADSQFSTPAATLDAASADGAASADASADASVAADTGADAMPDAGSRFCERNPGAALCADFDEPGGAALDGWTQASIIPAGIGTLAKIADSSTGSAPNAFEAVLPAQTTTTEHEVSLVRSGLTVATAIDVDFEMRVAAYDSNVGFLAASLQFGPNAAGTRYILHVSVSASQVTLFEQCPGLSDIHAPLPNAAVVVGQWRHVHLHVDFGQGTADFSYGQASLKGFKLHASRVKAPTRFALGVSYAAAPIAETRVRFDDVLVRTP